MKNKKEIYESEQEDLDMYDDGAVEQFHENDEISDEEAAFMNGYLE